VKVAALQIPGVWRGDCPRPAAAVASTRIEALDRALLGGWPIGALTQIVGTEAGLGFSLIIPALAAFTAAGRAVALVAPPYLPYAPALASRGVDLQHLLWVRPQDAAQAQWAAEQIVQSGLFAALACWGPALDGTAERRLQLAADAAQCLAFCFRTGRADGHSHAAVRLAVAPAPDAQLRVEVLKCRGGRAGHGLLHRCGELPVAA
jgi:hypothetical protein